jgi:hypothetical protein
MFHVPVTLLADYAGTAQLSDTTELRARTTQATDAAGGGAGNTPLGIDLLLEPSFQSHIGARQWDFDLGLAPLFIFPDLEQGFGCSECQVQTFESGRARIGWHTRRFQVYFSETAAFGFYSSANLLQPTANLGPASTTGSTGPMTAPGMTAAPTTTPVLQLTAAPAAITTGSLWTAAGFSEQLDRRSTLAFNGQYSVGGGLDASSRLALPFQYGVRLDGSLVHAVAPRDQLVTLAYGLTSTFEARTTTPTTPCEPNAPSDQSCAPESELAGISQGIRHALDRTSSLSVTAGAAFARFREGPADPYKTVVFPSGDITYVKQFDAFAVRGDGHLQLEASLVPAIDVLTDLASNRLQGVASFVDQLNNVVNVQASVSAAQTIPTSEPFALSLVSGALQVAFSLSHTVSLSVGERGLWQTEAEVGSFFSTFTYFDVTVATHPLRF